MEYRIKYRNKYRKSIHIIIMCLFLWGMISPVIFPVKVFASIPATPANISPADTTTGVILTPQLFTSDFFDGTLSHTHYASQWQITTVSGGYSNPLFDSGYDTGNKISLSIGAGTLNAGVTYYWRVRYQDNYGNWSGYSSQTSFTTQVSGAPGVPSNINPITGTTGILRNVTLMSSVFSVPDTGYTHAASHWQITKVSGDYSSPVYNSISDSSLTSLDMPPGTLVFNTKYYWHVRYQDSYGRWSTWSDETNFTVIASTTPRAPLNISPSDTLSNILLKPTLEASSFVDNDGDNHTASRWQISTTSGVYTSPVFDSGIDSTNLNSITLSSNLAVNTKYYWHVRYQDNNGNWSDWSTETSFTTLITFAPNTPANASPASGTTNLSVNPTLTGSAFSDIDTDDSLKAVQWQITTVSGNYANPVLNSTNDSSSLTISAGVLNYNTFYFWRLRYQDSYGNWSAWSTESSFSTTTSPSPYTPVNVSPSNNTFDILLAVTLHTSTFSDPQAGDTHYASRWQIRNSNDTYSNALFDSRVDTVNLTSITITSGMLKYDSLYYWHVRYQDSFGNWSDWSPETFFNTVNTLPPNKPVNLEPVLHSIGVSLLAQLKSSPFIDPDTGDSHITTQWQITTTSGNYTNTVYDNADNTSQIKTTKTIPQGTLTYNKVYYWHVRYQDSYGKWSNWSNDTSFTTVLSTAPSKPQASAPNEAATGISLTPELKSSSINDNDYNDSHTASQWQITITTLSTGLGDFTKTTFDSGTDTTHKTSIILPQGTVTYNTKYIWRVRYLDSYGNWSPWSNDASFTTLGSVAGFTLIPPQAKAGSSILFTDTSTNGVNYWEWDFGDGSNKVVWAAEKDRPPTGSLTHTYTKGNTYEVTLTVKGPGGQNTYKKSLPILATETPSKGLFSSTTILYVLAVVGIVILGVVYWRMRKRRSTNME